MLSNKHRPPTLSAVIGQNVSVNKIQGFLYKGNIPNAIFISGHSGFGKTTLARIIARYLNCTNGPKKVCSELNIEPCKHCKAMDTDNSQDYIEVNVGDVRGIDSLREIIAQTSLTPRNPYRIICLDEAHQLTNASMNCLLKPLEEPNPRNLWIICTTDPSKFPISITSRCLKLNLTSPTKDEYKELLNRVATAESRSVNDSTIDALAGNSRSFRAALAALDGLFSYLDSNTEIESEQLVAKFLEDNYSATDMQFIAELLNGNLIFTHKYVTEKVTDYNLFLQFVLDCLQKVICAVQGVPTVDSTITNLLTNETRRKKEISKAQVLDLIEIYNKFITAFKDMRMINSLEEHFIYTALYSSILIVKNWPSVKK